LLTVAATPASIASAPGRRSDVTKIRVNGRSAHAFLVNPDGTGGFVFPTQDEIAHTAALEFGYVAADPADPDLVILITGAGEIPNTGFTATATSAHLALTTPASYEVTRCVFNSVTGDISCAPTDPVTFDMTWTADGIGSVREKTKRTETFGAMTTKFDGEFASRTATVTGTCCGGVPAVAGGTLFDTESKTFIREVTLAANP
jgi:hypothetical protein